MLIITLAIMCGILSMICAVVALERFVFNKYKDCFICAASGSVWYALFLTLINAKINVLCLIPFLAFAVSAIVVYSYYKQEKPEKKMAKDRLEEFKLNYIDACTYTQTV